ncbi:MAG: ABC transporter permease [Chloroflexi bacterium]|nr:ABC transporter permease [Chloroflexota bacterium]
MSASTTAPSQADVPETPVVKPSSRARRAGRGLLGSAPIFLILLVVLVAIAVRNPQGASPEYYLALLKRAAPLMLLAAGQIFVIVSGEFDLSVGALITAVVVGAAVITDGDPSLSYPAIGGLLVAGVAVGAINGVATTRLRVPSFLVTLGMALVISGGVLYNTGGAPSGTLPQNLRFFGREGIEGVPVIGELPYSVIVLVVLGSVCFWLMHRTNFGRQIFAVGGNARAAALSGTRVHAVKTLAFVISAVSAVVAGILVAGFGGLSNDAGAGYEFQAISAVVLGGAVLGGGRGSVLTAMAGALTLEALFTLLNLLRLPVELRFTVQGVIIIAAVAYASVRLRASA